MIAEIQNGLYAKAWIAENEAGRPNFQNDARGRSQHPDEQVGRESARADAVSWKPVTSDVQLRRRRRHAVDRQVG